MNNLLRLIVLGVLLVFAVLMIGLGIARNVGDLSAGHGEFGRRQ